MKDPNDVLLEGVMEAHRRIERLVLVSLASSVWLLIVSGINPTLSGDKPIPKVELPLEMRGEMSRKLVLSPMEPASTFFGSETKIWKNPKMSPIPTFSLRRKSSSFDLFH